MGVGLSIVSNCKVGAVGVGWKGVNGKDGDGMVEQRFRSAVCEEWLSQLMRPRQARRTKSVGWKQRASDVASRTRKWKRATVTVTVVRFW